MCCLWWCDCAYTCRWVDDPVSGGVDLHVGLLPSVHMYSPLEERVPVHTEEQAHPPCTSMPERAAANLVSIFFQ